MNQRKEFVPGFDWVKLLGCMIVAGSHILPQKLPALPPVLLSAVSGIIPLFFLISGYLMLLSLERKDDPVCHVRRYILRYGTIYFFINLFANILHYLQIYQQTGILMIRDFLLVMATLPLWEAPMYQLWFIPSLLLGVFCASHAFLRGREKLFGLALAAPSICCILFSTYGMPIFGFSAADFSYPYHATVISHFAQGLLFVYLGMLIARYRRSLPKLRTVFCAAFAVLITEIFFAGKYLEASKNTHAFSFSQSIFSVLFFMLILRIRGSFLKKHHKWVNYFSILTFLLHPMQFRLLRHWISSPHLLLLSTLILNAFCAYALMALPGRSKERSHGF